MLEQRYAATNMQAIVAEAEISVSRLLTGIQLRTALLDFCAFIYLPEGQSTGFSG